MNDMFKALWRGIKAINKKVWVTLAFLAVIFSVGATWIGVANALAAFSPPGWPAGLALTKEQRATVSGNGGPAVMVGDWLYFVGNYVNTSDIRYRQNEHNRVTYGAIYRVYIDPKEGLLYEDRDKAFGTNCLCALCEDGIAHDLVPNNYVPHLLDRSRYQLIVPKVAGFDQAALWVFGNHLVYTSPNNERDRRGDLRVLRTDFFRVNLDGSDHRRLYTTANDMVTTDRFTVASYEGNVFILIHDGNMLRRISVTGNPGQLVTVSRNVQGRVALPIVTYYGEDFKTEDDESDSMWTAQDFQSLARSYSGMMRYVFYTEVLSEQDQKHGLTGIRIIEYDVLRNRRTDRQILDYTISLEGLSNGHLVYTAQQIVNRQPVALGLFATNQAISDTANINDLFNVSTHRLLGSDESVLGGGTVHWRTVHTNDEFVYAVLNGSTLYFFHKGTNNEAAPRITGVGRIILMNENTVHYVTSGGVFAARNIYGGAEWEGTRMMDEIEQNLRSWIVTRKSAVWHFYIESFISDGDDCGSSCTHGGSTTLAMLADVYNGGSFNGDRREFYLGRLDCKFLGCPTDE